MRKHTGFWSISFLLGLCVLFSGPAALANEGFDDGGGAGQPACADCHSSLANFGPAHGTHADLANNDCGACHAGGGRDNPPLSACVQCHGRDADAGGDDISAGIGRGLRQHHIAANAAACGNCHADAGGPAAAGEDVLPSFYASGLNAAGLDPCDGSEENFASRSVSLDNDGDGQTDSADTDCATNQPPVADAGGPYNGSVGAAVSFDGSASADPDGTITGYDWDFGDGTTGNGATPSHAYTTAGTFDVTLTVTDDGGLTDTQATTATITADPLPPVADAGGPYAGTVGSPVSFDGTGSSDPDGTITTFAWDFGDGGTGSGATPTHTYSVEGDFTVTLTVTDDDGLTASDTSVATIGAAGGNAPPVADANGPYSGLVGDTITFDASGSSDSDGTVVRYDWDYGDGTTAADAGPAPTHAYAVAGSYTVTVTVTDDRGDTDSDTATATISDPTPMTEGEAQYQDYCSGCHGDPWDGPAVDATLSGLRRVTGSRACVIEGSVFGTYVFPDGVPEMQFLQALVNDGTIDPDALAEYLNSQPVTGEAYYVTACAGCHGDDGSGGRVGESVLGDSAGEIREAIAEESTMRYLACLPDSDIDAMAAFLGGDDGSSGDSGDAGDDGDSDSGGGGAGGLPLLALLAMAGLIRRRVERAGR